MYCVCYTWVCTYTHIRTHTRTHAHTHHNHTSSCKPALLLPSGLQDLETKVEEWMAKYEEETEAKAKELEILEVHAYYPVW